MKEVVDAITNELHGGPEAAEEIEKFYFTKLSSLSQRVYSRKIHPSSLSQLASSISLEELPSSDVSDAYKTACKTAKLWAKLGNYEMLGGSSGSYRIFDSNNHSFGICKVSNEEPLAADNPRRIQRCKRILYQIFLGSSKHSLFKTIAGQAYVAEAAVRVIEREVVKEAGGSNRTFVPETHVAEISLGKTKARKASFQLWVEGNPMTAAEFLGVTQSYFSVFGTKNILPDELFDFMVIIDYLVGNHDRHAENWFILKNDDGTAKEIRLIDGGWALSPYHPNPWSRILLRNQYLWRKLDMARRPFTPKAITAIESLHKRRAELGRKIEEFYCQYFKSPEESKERAARLMERLDVLYQFRHETKAFIGNIRSDKDFIRAEKKATNS